MKKKPFYLALFASAVLTGIVGPAIPLRAGGTSTVERPMTTAPAWELKDVDGKPVRLSDFKSKVVVLDFWATWCGPCKLEIPGFVGLQKKYGGQGLVVIGVSLDDAGSGAVRSFMKQLAMNYPVVMGNQKVTRDYGGVEAIPTTFIINRNGTIVRKLVGFEEEKVFEKEIKALLRE